MWDVRDRFDKTMLSAANLGVFLIFMMDLCLQFFLHVQLPQSQGGFWIRNHHGIVRYYVKTTLAAARHETSDFDARST